MTHHDADELEAVRALGTVTAPTDLVLQRARRQLRTSMEAETPALSITASDTGGAVSRTGRRTWAAGPRRRAVLLLAAAAATAAAVTAPAVLPLGGGTPAASAQAAVFLNSVADRAAVQKGGDWKDAPYWYVRSRIQEGATVFEREDWLGHESRGWYRETRKEPIDEALPGKAEFFLGGGATIGWDGLWTLPTEPGALEKVLRENRNGAGRDADTELFVAVGDLLRASPAPPALRSALYRVAAKVPGVTLVGPVTDHQGRPGVAVERVHEDRVTRYVVDPANGRLLEESNTCRAKDLPECGGDWLSTYLKQGPVDTIRKRP